MTERLELLSKEQYDEIISSTLGKLIDVSGRGMAELSRATGTDTVTLWKCRHGKSFGMGSHLVYRIVYGLEIKGLTLETFFKLVDKRVAAMGAEYAPTAAENKE